MSAVDTLINRTAAFDFDEALLVDAMRSALKRHRQACETYRKLAGEFDDVRSMADVPNIPYLFVPVLKRYTLISGAPDRIKLTLKSSGTRGEKSEIHLDDVTLRRIRKIVFNIYRSFDMVSDRPTNYLCFTYDPRQAKDVGTAWSDKLLTQLARPHRVHYAIQARDGEWHMDTAACRRAMDRFEASGEDFRILGFPAYLWEMLKDSRKYRFSPNSYVITGGGWKGLADKEIPRSEFKQRVGDWLGIPPQNVRDLFGMVEHGVPYCECEAGSLHVPIYSRAYVRDPGTLQLLPEGEIGLLHLITPYLHSFPAISLLTTDVGRVTTGCACGRTAPVLEVVGRAGTVRSRGCAIAALDVLEAAVSI